MTDEAGIGTAAQVIRFVALGASNTLVTGMIFLVLSQAMIPSIAYSIAFIVGIGFAAAMTPRIVFGATASQGQRLRYVAWYLAVYLLGLVLVFVLHDRLLFANTAVVAITLMVTSGFSFLGARYLFASRVLREVGE